MACLRLYRTSGSCALLHSVLPPKVSPDWFSKPISSPLLTPQNGVMVENQDQHRTLGCFPEPAVPRVDPPEDTVAARDPVLCMTALLPCFSVFTSSSSIPALSLRLLSSYIPGAFFHNAFQEFRNYLGIMQIAFDNE